MTGRAEPGPAELAAGQPGPDHRVGDDERLRRWRLLLGSAAAQAMEGEDGARLTQADQARGRGAGRAL